VPPLSPPLVPLRKQLLETIAAQRYAVFLLPASCKELIHVYRSAVRTALGQNRSALILVPETHQVEPLRQVLSEDGALPTEAYHGELSIPARERAWTRIQRGEARLVIGTRSATFAPLVDLGLIVIDQEDQA